MHAGSLLFTGSVLYSFAVMKLLQYRTFLSSVSCVSKFSNLIMGTPKFVASLSEVQVVWEPLNVWLVFEMNAVLWRPEPLICEVSPSSK